MNDLAIFSTLPGIPAMSPDLRGWVLDDLDMEWCSRGTQPPIRLPRYRASTPAIRQEAGKILAAYRAASAPPSAELLHAWLQPMAFAVRNPVSAQSLDRMVPIFAAALSTMPVGAFTRKTWVRAMQTFKFWPSPADIAELLVPEAQEIRRSVEVLEFIVEQGS